MSLVSAGPSRDIGLGSSISSIREGSSSYPGGGSQGGSLPVGSLIFPESQNVNVGLQELAQKSWGKQEVRVCHGSWMPFLRASVLVRDLEGGGREKCEKKRDTSWGLPLLPWIILFLVVVGGGGSLNIHCPKPSFHFQGQT